MGDPYAADKPPVYGSPDPYAADKPSYDPNQQQMYNPNQQQMAYNPNQPQMAYNPNQAYDPNQQMMGQPMMTQPYPGQYNTGQQMVPPYQQQYPGQPMMVAQPYNTMQPGIMMTQPYGQQQPMMMQPMMMQPGMMQGGGAITVNIQQPAQYVATASPVAVVVVAKAPEFPGYKTAIGVYEESLLCCCDDCGACLKGCVCPCISFGHVARELANGDQKAGDEACLRCAIGSVLGLYLCCVLPQRIKVKNLIYGKPKGCDIEDCCSHCCCPLCALCQEDRIMMAVAKERKEKAAKEAAPGGQYMS